jgi:hypothetical protein
VGSENLFKTLKGSGEEPTPGEVHTNCAARAVSRSTPSGVKDMTAAFARRRPAGWRRVAAVLDGPGPQGRASRLTAGL